MPAWLRPSGDSLVSLASAASRKRFRRPLPIPTVLTGANLEIPIVKRRVRVLPGRKTKMWTYGGAFPGPTIRRPAGEPTSVTFSHQLPARAGSLSVHLHGGHTPAKDDGQPGRNTADPQALYCDLDDPPAPRGVPAGGELIAPGESRTYTYPGVEDGAAERASFQWYHDHRCGSSARNIWNGLAGMWIIDDEFEAQLGLPGGGRDIPLLIADRSFNKRNQLENPFRSPGRVPYDQETGRHVLVNGAHRPFKRVSARRYRLRVLNASNFRSYNLKLDGPAEMVQIATESGLMPQALRRGRILIGPGERVEVIVDFRKARGKRVRLVSARRPGAGGFGSKPFVGDLMEFRVSDEARADGTAKLAHGDPLRPLPGWVAEASPTHSHEWKIEVEGGIKPRWLINGRVFDPSYADATAALGEVVTWKLTNATSVAHLLHLHHTDWYMLKRNGATPPVHERCLKDTFFLDPHDELIVAGKISDYTGKYVVHCHMLDHEDHGLMSQFEVVPAA